MTLPSISSEKEYSVLLRELDPWRPAVGEVLRRHGLDLAGGSLRAGSLATYPAVLAGEHYVVKLFGPWWCGAESLEAESAAYTALAGSRLPVPALLAQGELGDGWSYLVLEQLRGRDLAAAREELDEDALASLALWLGRFCRNVRQTPLPRAGYLASSWERFRGFLETRRAELIHRPTEKSRLPPQLQAELEDWLPPFDDLIEADHPPVLLHGDLHDHHVFGSVEGSAFLPTGVIDFTDALAGDPYYDIGPLYVHTLRADRRLLAAWLEEADLPPAGAIGFPKRALAYTLLHEFDPIFRLRDELASSVTLDQVADELFAI